MAAGNAAARNGNRAGRILSAPRHPVIALSVAPPATGLANLETLAAPILDIAAHSVSPDRNRYCRRPNSEPPNAGRYSRKHYRRRLYNPPASTNARQAKRRLPRLLFRLLPSVVTEARKRFAAERPAMTIAVSPGSVASAQGAKTHGNGKGDQRVCAIA